MPLKRVGDNPTTSDVLLFDILTTDSNGCLIDPYMINKVTVYFVERNFVDGNTKIYQKTTGNATADQAAATAQQLACVTPTAANIANAQALAATATGLSTTTNVYFTDVNPVFTTGSEDYPAWLSTDTADSLLYHDLNTFGNGLDGKPILLNPATGMTSPIPGHFLIQWDSKDSAREGDYFICWTWTPNPAGDTLTAHTPFSLEGSTQLTQSIPTHFTVPGKYATLLDRYTPEMFKMLISPSDLTPDVLNKLNLSIASGFTTVENLANQIIDLLDANSCHEILIPYLSNLFNLKLRSGDPTLWRRQVKQAIPLFKRKGTLSALGEALAVAGMKLSKFTKLYQVISTYTWNDFFLYDGSGFITTYNPTTLNPGMNSNYAVWVCPVGGTSYAAHNGSVLSWSVATDGELTLTVDLNLGIGDQVLVRYEIAVPPNPTAQTIETYVQSLPLADQRTQNNDGTIIRPLKNWNVRVIEEDDPLFPLICPCTNAFADNLIFGHIRTDFPYSENIWNMDEYNGSTRESQQPCDIDMDFLDSCSCGLSSKFNLDVEIVELCDDRIKECQEVIAEYVPFHAVLHMINLAGKAEEFVRAPIETVETLIQYQLSENVIAGNASAYFNRFRGTGHGTPTRISNSDDFNPFDPDSGSPDNTYLGDVQRNVLATSQTVTSTTTGFAYNSGIYLFCPDVRFDKLGIAPNNLLEIFSPSTNQGVYSQLSGASGHTVLVPFANEPLDPAQFTFRLSNVLHVNGGGSIFQDDIFLFSDPTAIIDFAGAVAGTTTITLTGVGTFSISTVYPNGVLSLSDPDRLINPVNSANVPYVLGTYSGHGQMSVTRRGRLESADAQMPIISYYAKIGDYVNVGGTQYKIMGFNSSPDNVAYLANFTSGDIAGTAFDVYRRLVDNQIGNFDYRGLVLDCLVDQESGLNIQDGSGNPTPIDMRLESSIPGHPAFKSNFVVMIDQDYYLISDINQNLMTLQGPAQSWGTMTSGGTAIIYSILQFSNLTTNLTGVGETLNIDGQEYEFIDRRGNDTVHRVITRQEAPVTLAAMAITSLNDKSNGIRDLVSQDEHVSFTIEYADGAAHNGEI